MKYLFLLLLLQGCATITYGDFTYTRVGNQSIQTLAITTPDGLEVTLGRMTSEDDLLKMALELLRRLP